MSGKDRGRASPDPFASIESSHEYVTLLRQQVQQEAASFQEVIDGPTAVISSRHRDALRLVVHKLSQLEQQLACSGRILNDLRALRRLLLGEREDAAPVLLCHQHVESVPPAS